MEFSESFLKSHVLNRVAPIAFGALLGFGYYFFIGCSTGSCPITSNPWRSTAYGALMAAVLTIGNRANKSEKEASQKEES